MAGPFGCLVILFIIAIFAYSTGNEGWVIGGVLVLLAIVLLNILGRIWENHTLSKKYPPPKEPSMWDDPSHDR
jgi:hypothetical protein